MLDLKVDKKDFMEDSLLNEETVKLSELLLASQGASCFTVPRGTPTGYPPRPEGSSYYCK